MDLMQENEIQPKKESKGIKIWLIIVVVLIILLLITAVLLWMYSQKLQKEAFKVTIDGVYSTNASSKSELFLIQDNKVYTSIEEICSYIGYQYYPGGYRQYAEDRTKCYVTNSKEVVTFAHSNNEIVKYPVTNLNSEPQTFEISEEVVIKGNRLYINEDGLKKAFNLLIEYDASSNSVNIATLPYLVNYYENNITGASIESSTFEDYVKFNNGKALLKNLIIIQDENTKLYGVSQITNNMQTTPIITARYTKIEYMEGVGDFIVTSEDKKVGIIASDGITKVRPEFDKIQEIDKDIGLYLVNSGENQGVINRNGKVIVPQDYDSIGLDTGYEDKNITNKYILYGNCIPVKLNNKWGIINIEGERIIPVEYDGIGCKETSATGVRNTNGIILVPEIKGIVLEKDFETEGTIVKKYGIINYKGEPITDFILDSAYMTTVENVTNYYVTAQNQTIDIVDYWYKEMTNTDQVNNNQIANQIQDQSQISNQSES